VHITYGRFALDNNFVVRNNEHTLGTEWCHLELMLDTLRRTRECTEVCSECWRVCDWVRVQDRCVDARRWHGHIIGAQVHAQYMHFTVQLQESEIQNNRRVHLWKLI